MNYVTACLTFFNAGAPTVTIRARGQAISNAVDAVELLRRAFVKDLEVQSISIDTEELASPGRFKTRTSTIDITVSKSSKHG